MTSHIKNAASPILKPRLFLVLCLAALELTACGTRTSRQLSLLDETQATILPTIPLAERRPTLTITMSRWKDAILIDSAVGRNDAGKCVFSGALNEDRSTKKSPVQIYWAIFDPASEIRNGSEIREIFSETDHLKGEMLKKNDDARALGFAQASLPHR